MVLHLAWNVTGRCTVIDSQAKIDKWFGGDIGGLSRHEAMQAIERAERDNPTEDEWQAELANALCDMGLWDVWRNK